MAKIDHNNEPVTLTIPYIEAIHWQELIVEFDDKKVNGDCLLCKALLTHLSQSIKGSAKILHQRMQSTRRKSSSYLQSDDRAGFSS